jgi:phage terminase small subunit
MPMAARPAPLKILEGNPSHRPILPEPRPTPGLPTCPGWLLPEAKKEWRRIGPELARIGLMTVADRVAFAGYCQAWARWMEAEMTGTGSAQERTLRVLLATIQRFGLSPADRTRLAGSEAARPPEGIAGLLD